MKRLLALLLCASNAFASDDPLEGWNRGAQSFNDGLDDYIMKPIAHGYDYIMPQFAHTAVSNFFANLDDIGVFVNDALQGKLEQSGSDFGRFLANSTLGLGGFIDIGTLLELNKHNEDFDQTLGVWGIPMGPYLVVPFVGPSSPRGVIGLVADAGLNPITYTGLYFAPTIATEVSLGAGGLRAVNGRSNALVATDVAAEAAIDKYVFYKSAYIQQRNYLVNDGKVGNSGQDVLDFNDPQNDTSFGPIKAY